jgi:mutator protein MutT
MTTAAGVVFLAKDTGRCLLQLRNSDKRFKNTWGFWGGMIEKGETVYQCIQRELTEEIGFVPELAKLNPIDVYQSRDKHFYYYSFVYLVEKEFSPGINAAPASVVFLKKPLRCISLKFGL